MKPPAALCLMLEVPVLLFHACRAVVAGCGLLLAWEGALSSLSHCRAAGALWALPLALASTEPCSRYTLQLGQRHPVGKRRPSIW